MSGRGHIYSYEIVAHAIQPGFKEWTPYAVVLVELDEQRGKPTEHEALRIIANLVTPELRPEPEANVAIGKRVRVIFQDLSEDFALPQFTLTGEPPRAAPELPELRNSEGGSAPFRCLPRTADCAGGAGARSWRHQTLTGRLRRFALLRHTP